MLSRLNYNNVVYHQLPNNVTHRLQRVQLTAASFVLNRFSSISDVLKLGWLTVKYHRDLSLSRIICKALYNAEWSSCLRLDVRPPTFNLRSSSERNLVVSQFPGTFQDCAARLFNSLPKDIKNITDAEGLLRKCKSFHFSSAKSELE